MKKLADAREQLSKADIGAAGSSNHAPTAMRLS